MKIVKSAPQRVENIRSGFMCQAGTTLRDANVDGSVTPVIMVFGPGLGFSNNPDEAWVMENMTIIIHSVTNVAETKYGGIDALTNGIDIEVHDSYGLVFSFTNSDPLKSNNDLLSYGFDTCQNLFDVNPRSVSAAYKFGNGCGVLLDGTKGEKFIIRINDDLTSLITHFIKIESERVIL
jgi:hypothetical protein